MKAQVDKQDLGGWTALHIASTSLIFRSWMLSLIVREASAGHQEIVVELLGAGADVKKTNDKGLTAL